MSDYDALADLFLSEGGPAVKAKPAALRLAETDTPSRARQVAAPRREVHVEGLILGHLPVLGAAWVMQYAKHTADRLGEPVGLLRVQGGQASVDVVNLRGTAAATRFGPMTNERATLEEGIDAALRWARHWLVRVDDTSEPNLAGLAGLNAVTLLTGADDAAVVACYRTIKGLHALAIEGETTPPALHLAIMGATDDKATSAESKLRRAAMTFLGRDIDLASCVSKIGASAALPFYRGEWTSDTAEALALLRRESSSLEPDIVAPAEERRDSPPPTPVTAPPTFTTPKPIPADAATTPPARVVNVPPPDRTSPALPEGLAPLDYTCPHAPTVILASGENGTLHLVARAGTESVPNLLAAASWAGEHARLLALAFPALSEHAVEGGPVLHVMTDDARTVRALLDTAVHTHLVIELPNARVVKPLN